ncbi:MAG: ferritin-like domain-containing protein [Alphaproteobacteria bacterium]|nr:ferritin-like domain-containing protein [Alphaproteobacteria bacterium]
MKDGNITKDAVYDAVPPDDFASMLDLDRYGRRSGDFDRIIAASHDHFWDPLDPRYIDYDLPFDMENEALLPDEMIGALNTKYVSDHLSDRRQRVRFVNASVHRMFSSILHGEQGALNLSASLCHVLLDPGAQEYAANQVREEARHVTAFAKYIKARWGRPAPCSPALQGLLVEVVASPAVYKKIVGMQMLVEGLAMGALATFYQKLRDPLGRRLVQLVMTDEAFHHKFGKIWADRTVPKLSAKEHTIIEYWAAHCFQALLFNLVAPTEQRDLYEEFGLDPDRVIAEFRTVYTDAATRNNMKEASHIFRVLTKTLLNAGIITERTRAFYGVYVDLDELAREGTRMIGDDIAEEGIRFLKAVNFKDGIESAKLLAVG